MIYKPHDYQKYATEFILSHPVAAVFLSMGLGKTVLSLDAIEQLIYDRLEVSKVLVIAPLRVAKVTWSDEIKKWENLSHLRYSVCVGTEKERIEALNQDADIYIINRENLQWLVEKSGVPFEFDMVVIDELSSFKNWNSKRVKAFIFVDAVVFKGYQCIRTGIIPDQDTKVAVTLNTSSFGDYALFGARTSTSADKFGIFFTSSTQISGQFATESVTAEVDDYSGTYVTVELSKEGLKRDGVVIAEFTEAEFTAPVELVIGTYNTNGTLDSRYFKGQITKIEVWQGEEQQLDLVPCVDENLQVCFYDNLSGNCLYNSGYGKFGFVDSERKYDEATKLVEVTFEELTAEVFRTEGFEDFPRSEVLTRLVNPSLLYWHDSEDDLPTMTVSLKAVPPVQTVYSKNTQMIDSTILGIEKVELEADDTTLFAFSFDAGQTWKAYIENAWVNLSEETSGMSRETVEAIGTDAWAIANEQMQYMVRFTLIEGGYCKRIIIHYIN